MIDADIDLATFLKPATNIDHIISGFNQIFCSNLKKFKTCCLALKNFFSLLNRMIFYFRIIMNFQNSTVLLGNDTNIFSVMSHSFHNKRPGVYFINQKSDL
jgi:hypothetical protein